MLRGGRRTRGGREGGISPAEFPTAPQTGGNSFELDLARPERVFPGGPRRFASSTESLNQDRGGRVGSSSREGKGS